MARIKSQENQSIFDIALQEYGSLEGLFNLLDDNEKIQVDAALSVYNDIEIKQAPVRREIKDFYLSRGVLPATSATTDVFGLLNEMPEKPQGISYMEIENDFVVCPPNILSTEGVMVLEGRLQVLGGTVANNALNGALAYRIAGTDASFQFIEFTNVTRVEPAFTLEVLPNTNYEIAVLTERFSARVEVSTPIDQLEPNRNIFNTTVAKEATAQRNDFVIRLLIANQAA